MSISNKMSLTEYKLLMSEENKERLGKYNSKKITLDGIKFDSQKETNIYCELKLLEESKVIKNLVLQPKFILQEAFEKNGKKYKAITYTADFQYEENGKIIIIDVKGKRTDVFNLKLKLFEYKFPNLHLTLI